MTESNIRTPLPGETEDEMWDRLLADAHADMKKPGPWTAERIMKWAPLFDDDGKPSANTGNGARDT